MKSMMHKKSKVNCGQNRGFTALVSTVILATGVLAFSISTLASSVMYADMVDRREIRIQTSQNLAACLDTIRLMIARDYHMSGLYTLSEFGCSVNIMNDFNGNHSVDAISELSHIKQISHVNI